MRVRFLLDEDTEKPLASKLSKAGHNVERVVEADGLGGGSDDIEVRDYAAQTDRIIVTYDDHFLAFNRNSHPGIFYLTNQHISSHRLFTLIQTVLENYPNREALPQHVFISENLD